MEFMDMNVYLKSGKTWCRNKPSEIELDVKFEVERLEGLVDYDFTF